MPHLIFCFPFHGAGGVPNLFLRIAQELAEDPDLTLSVIDYADGFMAKNKTHPRVSLICYDESASVNIPANAVVIFQAMTPWSIFPALNIPDSCPIFFWHLHPFNFTPLVPYIGEFMSKNMTFYRRFFSLVLRGLYKKLRTMQALLTNTRSLVYIDGQNLRSTKTFLDTTNEGPILALSVPAATRLRTDRFLTADSEVIRFCWVGRLCDFKYPILWYTLEKLNQLVDRFDARFEFDVIGEGEYSQILRQQCKSLDKLNVRFLGEMAPDKLTDHYVDHTDMVLAMGTSAMEAASCGIPTVLLDMCYGKVKEGYKFHFLHRDNIQCSVAELIDDSHIVPNNTSLFDCVTEVLNDYQRVGEQVRQYVVDTHELPTICNKLLDHVRESSCTWGMLKEKGLLERGGVYRSHKLLRHWMLRLNIISH